MSSYNEFFKFLIKNGCKVDREGAGSCKMMTGPNGKKFPFHNHGGKLAEITDYAKRNRLSRSELMVNAALDYIRANA